MPSRSTSTPGASSWRLDWRRRCPRSGFQAPEATYLAWLDVSAFDLGEEPGRTGLLEVGRVALSPGRPFGPGAAGHVRMNFATSEAILDQVIDRVVATLTG